MAAMTPFSAVAQLTWGVGGVGGTGTWDSTTANWYNGSSNVAWVQGGSGTFTGAGGTVSLGGTEIASQLTFNASAPYTLTRTVAAGNVITGASSALTLQTDSDLVIVGQIDPSTTVTKAGSGELRIGFPQTNPFVIQGGVLAVGTTSTITMVQLNGSTIVNNGTIAFTASLAGVGDQISGTGDVRMITLQGGALLATNNTYTGKTLVENGSLGITKMANGGQPSSIGASSSAAENLIFGGGAITVNDTTDRLFTVGTAAGNSVYIGSGGAANFTNTGAIAFGTTGVHTITLGSNITGSVGTFFPLISDESPGNPTNFVKTQVGTWNLTNNNTYTGTTGIVAGVLGLGSSGALGNTSSITFGGITGGTLQYSAANSIDYSSKIVNSTKAISIDTNGQNITFASGIGSSNTGGLAKLGTGSLTLSGANSYMGTTTISSDSLIISNTGSLSGSRVSITGTGILSEASGASISGAGITFTQTANTTSTLAGTNTFSGATSVSAGKLNLTGTGSMSGSSITVSSTGIFQEDAGSVVNGAGGFTHSSSGTSTLAGTNTYTGATSITNGIVDLPGSLNGSNITTSSNGVLNQTSTGSISGNGSFTQNGSYASFLNGTNTYTGETLISNGTLYLGATGSMSGSNISISGGGGMTEYSGGTIFGNGSFTLSNTDNVYFAGTNTYTGVSTVNSGSLNLTATGSLSGSNIITGGTGIFREVNGGSIGGVGTTFTQGSTGTSILSGSNTFTGVTNINGGTLNLGSSDALGGNGSLTFRGGTLQHTSGNTEDYSSRIINSTGAITIDTNSQNVTYASGLSASNTGGLTKMGAGKLSLTGATAFTGPTSVTAGTLSLDTGGSLGGSNITTSGTGSFQETSGASITGAGVTFTQGSTGASTLASTNTYTGATSITTGTLTLDTGGSLAGSSVATSGTGIFLENGGAAITGAGITFTQGSTGTSSFSGDNTYTGTTNFNKGVLSLGSTGALGGGGNLNFGGGTLQFTAANTTDYSPRILNSTGAISIDTNSQNVTFATALSASNTGGLTKLGAGTLTLTGTGSASGMMTVNAGELDLNASAGPSLSGSLTINGGTAKYLQGNQINSTADLIVSGGVLSLQGFNQTLVNLQITGGSITSSGGILTSTGAFNLEAGTIMAPLAGAVALNKSNSGTAFLYGVNTYTGKTNINNGYLVLLSAGALNGTSGIVFGGGSLRFSDLNTTDYSSIISNSTGAISIDTGGQNVTFASNLDGSNTGGFRKLGTGTLSLSGSNAFTGTTTIDTGTLRLNSASALGASNNLVFYGGVLQYTASNTTDFSSKIANSTGAISIDTNGQNVTFASGLSSSNTSGLNKLGSGTLILFGGNAYTGTTTITAGTLQFARTVSLYGGTTTDWTSANIIVNSGATLALNVGGSGQFTTTNIGTLLSQAGFRSGSSIGLDTTNAPGGALTYSTAITNPNSGANVLGLTKLGTGRLTLGAGNTFSGPVSINNGTLGISSVGTGSTTQSLGKGTSVTLGVLNSTSGTLLYTGGTGTLDKNITANGNGTIQNSGSGTLTLSGSLTKANTTLTLTGGTAGIVVSGRITGGTPATFNSDLNITGGTTTLSNTTNNYTGPTTVSGSATLVNGASNVLPAGTALTLGNATDGAVTNTYNLNGFNQTIASLGSTSNVAHTNRNIVTNSGASGTNTLILTGLKSDNTAASSTFGGILQDGASARTALQISGGTHTLSGSTNTYQGGTAVASGATLLLANGTTGSATGTGTLTVNGTLGGAGTAATSSFLIAGAVHVGTGTDTTSQMTLKGATGISTFTNANLTFNLNGTVDGQANLLNMGNTSILFSQTLLTLNLQNLTPTLNGTYTLIAGLGSAAYTGISTFTNAEGQAQIVNGENLNFTFTANNTDLSSSYLFLNGDDIAVHVVPEPTTWSLIGSGLLLLAVFSRRRKSGY